MEAKGQITHQRPLLFFILLILLIVNDFYSYRYLPAKFSQFTYPLFLCFLLFSKKEFTNTQLHFRWLVLALTFYPFVTCFTSQYFFNQSVVDSAITLLRNLAWTFYFVLIRLHPSKKVVIKAVFIFSTVMFLIQMIQQVTYPLAFFGVKELNSVDGEVSTRNGIYRFLLHGNGYFPMIVLLYYIERLRQKYTLSKLFICALMFGAVYFSLTRQVIASCLLTIFLSFLFERRSRGKLKAIALLCVVGLLLYIYSDALFGDMIRKTGDELNKNNIRWEAGLYFLQQSVESKIGFFFGHGLPRSGEFLYLSNMWGQYLHFYTSDVGYIGMLYHYGIIYILLYFRMVYLILFKYRRELPAYPKLYVVFTGLMSFLIFPFTADSYVFVAWSIILYLCEIEINEVKLKRNEYNIQYINTSI